MKPEPLGFCVVVAYGATYQYRVIVEREGVIVVEEVMGALRLNDTVCHIERTNAWDHDALNFTNLRGSLDYDFVLSRLGPGFVSRRCLEKI